MVYKLGLNKNNNLWFNANTLRTFHYFVYIGVKYFFLDYGLMQTHKITKT